MARGHLLLSHLPSGGHYELSLHDVTSSDDTSVARISEFGSVPQPSSRSLEKGIFPFSTALCSLLASAIRLPLGTTRASPPPSGRPPLPSFRNGLFSVLVVLRKLPIPPESLAELEVAWQPG